MNAEELKTQLIKKESQLEKVLLQATALKKKIAIIKKKIKKVKPSESDFNMDNYRVND